MLKVCLHQYTTEQSTRGFFGCVSPFSCNPAAHGGVSCTEVCDDCGAERKVNVNGRHAEYGPWIELVQDLYLQYR